MMPEPTEAEAWLAAHGPDLEEARPEDALRLVATEFPGAVSCAISLGLESSVLADLVAKSGAKISLFTLDTGRLFPESYELWERLEAHTGLRIRAYFPDAAEVEALVNDTGINLFRHNPAFRRRCCEVRKVRPLRRALAGHKLWVTGLRSEDSNERAGLGLVNWDAGNGLLQLNPLFHWSLAELDDYTKEHGVPRHPLFDQGMKSIGCAPCTRATAPGEPLRAGRWWWEDAEKKECGLHCRPKGCAGGKRKNAEARSQDSA